MAEFSQLAEEIWCTESSPYCHINFFHRKTFFFPTVRPKKFSKSYSKHKYFFPWPYQEETTHGDFTYNFTIILFLNIPHHDRGYICAGNENGISDVTMIDLLAQDLHFNREKGHFFAGKVGGDGKLFSWALAKLIFSHGHFIINQIFTIPWGKPT